MNPVLAKMFIDRLEDKRQRNIAEGSRISVRPGLEAKQTSNWGNIGENWATLNATPINPGGKFGHLGQQRADAIMEQMALNKYQDAAARQNYQEMTGPINARAMDLARQQGQLGLTLSEQSIPIDVKRAVALGEAQIPLEGAKAVKLQQMLMPGNLEEARGMAKIRTEEQLNLLKQTLPLEYQDYVDRLGARGADINMNYNGDVIIKALDDKGGSNVSVLRMNPLTGQRTLERMLVLPSGEIFPVAIDPTTEVGGSTTNPVTVKGQTNIQPKVSRPTVKNPYAPVHVSNIGSTEGIPLNWLRTEDPRFTGTYSKAPHNLPINVPSSMQRPEEANSEMDILGKTPEMDILGQKLAELLLGRRQILISR